MVSNSILHSNYQIMPPKVDFGSKKWCIENFFISLLCILYTLSMTLAPYYSSGITIPTAANCNSPLLVYPIF